MNSGRRSWLFPAMLAAAFALAASALAVDTKRWEFTTPSDYEYDPTQVRVNTTAPGYAELVLQADMLHQATLADYAAASNQVSMNSGAPCSVLLKKSGSTYPLAGTFTSRVIEGGAGPAWEKIRVAQYAESYPTAPMVLYMSMENDAWLEQVSGASGMVIGTPSFTSSAKVGKYAGLFPGSGTSHVKLPLANPLFGKSAATISCWFRFKNYILFEGLLGTDVSDLVDFRLRLGSPAEKTIQWLMQTSGGYVILQAGVLPNQWYHIACTWDGSAAGDGVPRLYLNGKIAASGLSYKGTIAARKEVYIGTDTENKAERTWDGEIDDVMFFAKAASSEEVGRMYDVQSRFARPVRVQVRSASDPALIGSQAFVGPDGTTNSFYAGDTESLVSCPAFNVTDTYLQYRAVLNSNPGRTKTPYLSGVYFERLGAIVGDLTTTDFMNGTMTGTALTYSNAWHEPYVGLTKLANGGYTTNGYFYSRVLDAGRNVSWQQLWWKLVPELDSAAVGLISLWHMNGTWEDSLNLHSVLTTPNAAFTSLAKLGAKSALFDGAANQVSGFGDLGSVKTIEFWINDRNPHDEVMTLTSSITVSLTNGIVTVKGVAAPGPSIYVNGSAASRRLSIGWNHVALVFEDGLRVNALNVGQVGTGYMEGMLDELAAYSRVLPAAEIYHHALTGQRAVAGEVKFQVASGNTLDKFVGPGGNTNTFFVVPPFGSDPNLGGAIPNQRFFQYRMIMSANGQSTPAVGAVKITSGAADIPVLWDSAANDFEAGSFENTIRYGDPITLRPLSLVGPGYVDIQNEQLLGLWHLDDADWATGTRPVVAVRGTSGRAYGGARTTYAAKIGVKSGYFDGNASYVDSIGLPFGIGDSDFSVSLWMKTPGQQRRTLITTADASWYFSMEVNSDGAGEKAGSAAFLLRDGGHVVVAAASAVNVSDGQWHNLVGVRKGSQVVIYVDGERAGATMDASLGSVGDSSGLLLGTALAKANYYSGYLDEVAIYSTAISEKEIGQNAGIGYQTASQGLYEGVVIERPQPSIWQTLSWVADAPYGRPLSAAQGLAALWHMEEAASPITNSASGVQLNGVVSGAGFGAAGRLGRALTFNGSGFARVAHHEDLEPTLGLTVEAWVNLTDLGSRGIVDKSSGGNGYTLATDSTGRPTFTLGDATCTGFAPLRSGKWSHLAGVADGTNLLLYADGQVVAVMRGAIDVASGAPLDIGRFGNGTGYCVGLIDEVAVHKRALSGEEILDHYRAGVGTLAFQARVGSGDLRALPYIGPFARTNGFFVDSLGSALLGHLPLGSKFQCRAILSAEDSRYGPQLGGMTEFASGYPTINPTIQSTVAAGHPFPGHLSGFSDLHSTNLNTGVKYQVTGDSGTPARWFYWDAASSLWTEESALGPQPAYDYQASPVGSIAANIGSFYSQLYDKSGGVFRVRAFLHSEGDWQTAIDWVELRAAAGRVVVTSPNGREVGELAWLIGVPYDVTWTHTGNVAGNVTVQYSINGGATWVNIATGVPASADKVVWTTPQTLSTRTLVRVRHETDTTIFDQSDREFQLVQSSQIVVPNGGERWYIGETNAILWKAAFGVGQVVLSFAGNDDWTNPFEIAIAGGARTNRYAWATPMNDVRLVSERAKIRSQTRAGSFTDYSDDYFTMAGAVFLEPGLDTGVKKDSPYTVRWKSSACGPAVRLELQTVANGPWLPVADSVTNATGVNTYIWNPTNQPTEYARLRLTSLSDSRARGITEQFKIAAIELRSPLGNTDLGKAEKWLMNTTHDVIWVSAGGSDRVNILFSTNSGTSWMVITNNYPNINGFGVTNSFPWTINPLPSFKTKVRVEDAAKPTELYSISPADFHIAGVRIVWPNGGDEWPRGQARGIRWQENAVGQECTVEISYDGTTWETIAGPGYFIGDLEVLPYFVPDRPTVRGSVRITADNPAPFTNVFDTSDTQFSVAGVKFERPVEFAKYTIGTMNPVSFLAAATKAPGLHADLYYAGDGVHFDTNNPINTIDDVFSESFPGRNTYDWTVQPTLEPSEFARLKIKAGNYTDISPQFTVRGLRFDNPTLGTIVPPGTRNIQWTVAGIATDTSGDLYVSNRGKIDAAFTNKINAAPIPIGAGFTSWNVLKSVGPSTNAMLKVVITSSPTEPADLGFTSYSQPFVLQGIRVDQPAAGVYWSLNTQQAIRWTAAAGGPRVNLYYSPNNGTNYDVAPIDQAVASADGVNNYTWSIGTTRLPSRNARVKISSATVPGIEGISAPFFMQGIKVTKPTKTDIYATTDATNLIKWIGVINASPARYDVFYSVNGGPLTAIAAGVTNTTLNWSIPPSAISTSVVVTVRDSSGTFSSSSDPFQVVSEPTISVVAPEAGAFWRVGETHDIEWARGGTMENDFSVYFQLKPYAVSNLIEGTVVYDAQRNMFSIPWSVPDQLTQCRIVVQHNTRPEIRSVSGVFNLVGTFQVLEPNGGESWFARKPMPVRWTTRGSVRYVDIYYSVTPPYRASSWVKINNQPIENNYRLNFELAQKTYQWTLADVRTPLTRFRVQEAAYTNRFDAMELVTPGEVRPFDDSDEPFTVDYYKVHWVVFDAVSSNRLDRLAMVDTYGHSAAGLSSIPPSDIKFDYPWGRYNSQFFREYFNDAAILYWEAENTSISIPGPAVWTQYVAMTRSSAEKDYNVLANFSYEASNKTFTIHAWLQRSGEILADSSGCRVTIYDAEGNIIDEVTKDKPQTNGVFWLTWDASALDSRNVYFAKVSIDFSGHTYNSGLTFTLMVPASDEVERVVKELLGGLQTNIVTDITQSVGRVHSDLTAFRSETAAGISRLTDLGQATTGMLTTVKQDVADIKATVVTIGGISNELLSVLGPQLASVTNQIASMRQDTLSGLARILTRPDTFVFGTTNTVLYKTRGGYTPGQVAWEVLNMQDQVVENGSMTEIVAGIYQANITTDWGLSRYRMVCADPSARDSIAFAVVSEDINTVPAMMMAMSNKLQNIEVQVLGMSSINEAFTNSVMQTLGMISLSLGQIENEVTNRISGIQDTVNSISNNLAVLDDLGKIGAEVSSLTNAIAKVMVLTNISQMVVSLTNAIKDVDWGDIDDVTAKVSALTNTLLKVDWTALPEIRSNVGRLTNSMAGVNFRKMAQDLTVTTNRLGALKDLEAIAGQIGSLSNALKDVSYVTNVVGEVRALNQKLSPVDFARMSANLVSITNTLEGLDALQQIADQIKALSNTVSGITGLTNMITQMDAVYGSIYGIDFNALTGNVSEIRSIVEGVDGLEAIAGQITGLSNAVEKLSAMTNLSSKVDAIKTQLGDVNFQQLALDAANVAGQIAGVNFQNLTGAVGRVEGSLKDLENLQTIIDALGRLSNTVDRLTAVTNLATDISGLTNALRDVNWQDIRNIQTTVNTVTNQLKDLTGLQAILDQMGDLSNAVAGISGVTNMIGQMGAVYQKLEPVDVEAMARNVTGMAQQIAGINFRTTTQQVDRISKALTGVDFRIMATNIVDMKSSVDDLAELRDIADQLSTLTNTVDRISGITNLAVDIAGLTNALRGVNWADIMTIHANVTNILASVQGLSELDALAQQMRGVSNALVSIGSVTGMVTQVDSIAATLQGVDMRGLTANVTTLTNRLGSFDWNAILAMQRDLGSVTNTLISMKDLSTIAEQIRGLSNSIDKVVAVTNIGAQISDLTNALQGVNWADIRQIQDNVNEITNTLASLTDLRDLADQIAGLSNAVSQIAGVTGMVGQVDSMAASLQGVDLRDMSRNVVSITNRLGVFDWNTVLAMQTDLRSITNTLSSMNDLQMIAEQMRSLSNSITKIAGITNIGAQVGELTNALQGVDWNDIREIQANVKGITNTLAGLTGLTDIAGQIGGLSNAIAQISGVTNMTVQVEGIAAALQAVDLNRLSQNVTALTNTLAAFNWNTVLGMQEDLISVTNVLTSMSDISAIADQMRSLSNSITKIAGITNIGAQVGELTNALQGVNWEDIRGIEANVVSITNTLAGLGGLQALASQMAGISNAVAGLNDMTNMVTQMDQVAGAVSGIDFAAMQRDLVNLTNTVTSLGTLKTVVDQLAAVTNSIAQLGDMTNVPSQVEQLLATVSNANFGAMSAQIADLTNAVTTLAEADLVSMAQQVQSLTNSLAGLAGLQGVELEQLATTGLVGRLEQLVGGPGDSGTAATLFGQVASIESRVTSLATGQVASIQQRVEGIESTSLEAATQAKRARTQAQTAASGVQSLRGRLRAADFEGAKAEIAGVRTAVAAIRKELGGVGGDASRALEVTRRMATTINELATSEGFPNLLKLPPLNEAGAPGGKGPSGVVKEQSITLLNQNIEEIKGTMLHFEKLRQMMEQKVYEPVVTEMLLPGAE